MNRYRPSLDSSFKLAGNAENLASMLTMDYFRHEAEQGRRQDFENY